MLSSPEAAMRSDYLDQLSEFVVTTRLDDL